MTFVRERNRLYAVIDEDTFAQQLLAGEERGAPVGDDRPALQETDLRAECPGADVWSGCAAADGWSERAREDPRSAHLKAGVHRGCGEAGFRSSHLEAGLGYSRPRARVRYARPMLFVAGVGAVLVGAVSLHGAPGDQPVQPHDSSAQLSSTARAPKREPVTRGRAARRRAALVRRPVPVQKVVDSSRTAAPEQDVEATASHVRSAEFGFER